MHPYLRNTLAVIVGLLIGSLVNIGLIMISSSIIPPPDGADVSTTEGLKKAMHLFEAKHFLFPFLAHALGTFSGALVTVYVAASNQLKMALIIGLFFLIGGIASIFKLPSPLWFSIVDLTFAYIPMAYFAFSTVKK